MNAPRRAPDTVPGFCYLSVRQGAAATMLRMVFGPHISVLGRGLGELPNKRKGVAFWSGERSENGQKDIPFHCLLTNIFLEPEY